MSNVDPRVYFSHEFLANLRRFLWGEAKQTETTEYFSECEENSRVSFAK
jgi:hypothetical protein